MLFDSLVWQYESLKLPLAGIILHIESSVMMEEAERGGYQFRKNPSLRRHLTQTESTSIGLYIISWMGIKFSHHPSNSKVQRLSYPKQSNFGRIDQLKDDPLQLVFTT